MDAVERWAPIFTRYFSDDALLNMSYALGAYDGRINGRWCKLCDGPVRAGQAEEHLAEHAEELRAWRKRRRDEAERKRRAALAERAAERKVMQAVEGEGSGVSTERYLRNRITSARYRLNHPEKYRRESWTAEERLTIQKSIDEASAELADLREEA